MLPYYFRQLRSCGIFFDAPWGCCMHMFISVSHLTRFSMGPLVHLSHALVLALSIIRRKGGGSCGGGCGGGQTSTTVYLFIRQTSAAVHLICWFLLLSWCFICFDCHRQSWSPLFVLYCFYLRLLLCCWMVGVGYSPPFFARTFFRARYVYVRL